MGDAAITPHGAVVGVPSATLGTLNSMSTGEPVPCRSAHGLVVGVPAGTFHIFISTGAACCSCHGAVVGVPAFRELVSYVLLSDITMLTWNFKPDVDRGTFHFIPRCRSRCAFRNLPRV